MSFSKQNSVFTKMSAAMKTLSYEKQTIFFAFFEQIWVAENITELAGCRIVVVAFQSHGKLINDSIHDQFFPVSQKGDFLIS